MPWWGWVAIPAAALLGAAVAFLATMAYIAKGLRF